MASPRSTGANGSEDGADAVGDAFQLVAQGLAQLQSTLRREKLEAERKVQEAERRMQKALYLHNKEEECKVQKAENRMQKALRLQEERAATALREMKRKLQEKDDAIRSLQQRNEETLEKQTAVDELTPEGSGGQRGLQSLEDGKLKMEEVESSVPGKFRTLLSRDKTVLIQYELPQSARASFTTAASAREAPATGGAVAGGEEEPSYSTPTTSGAGHQSAAPTRKKARCSGCGRGSSTWRRHEPLLPAWESSCVRRQEEED